MFPKNLSQLLNDRIRNHSLRELSNHQFSIDFFSNDYLGYARNEEISALVLELNKKSPTRQHGSTGSRLISGNHEVFQKVEDKAKDIFQSEAALFYNSGYDANIGLLSAVLKPKDIVFYDELCHASIRDGLQLANAKAYKFKHCDYQNLEDLINRQIERLEFENIYIVTESVFSMDGDITDISKLVALKHKFNCYLIIDEAHAVGVCGRDYKGLTLELSTEIFARIITCGKALGSHGAFVLGSKELKEFLVNFSRPLIYTTAASPQQLISILAALVYFENENSEKNQLKFLVDYFNNQLQHLGLQHLFLQSDSAIQSLIISDNLKAKSLAKTLNEKGIGIKAILHPTVPKGKERLRICLHSFNTKEEIDLLLKTLTIAS